MSWMNQPTVTPSQAGQDRQGVIGVTTLQTLEQALTAARTPTTGNVPPVKGIELRADIFTEDTIRLDGLPSGFVVFGGGYTLVARHGNPVLRLAGSADLSVLDLNLRLTVAAPAVLVDTAANTTLLQNLRVQLPEGVFFNPLFSTSGFANNLVVDGLTIQQGASPTTAIELLSAGVWSACIFRQVRGRTTQVTSVANPTLVRCRFLDLDSVFELSPVGATDCSFAQIKARVGGANLADLGASNTLVDFSGSWAALWGSTLRQSMLATGTGPTPGTTTQTNLPGRVSFVPVDYTPVGVPPFLGQPKDTHIRLIGSASGNMTIDAPAAGTVGALLILTCDVATLGGLNVVSGAGQRLDGGNTWTAVQYSSLTLIFTAGGFWQELSRTPSVGGGGGGASWGSITGTLSAQTDLQAALDAKATAPTFAKVAAIRTSSVVALADITDFVFPVAANTTYEVKAKVVFTTAAATTGLRLGFNSPAGTTSAINVVVPLTNAAAATELKQSFAGASGNLVGTAAVGTAVAEVEGFVYVGGTAGNFSIQFASEVAASDVNIQVTSGCRFGRVP